MEVTMNTVKLFKIVIVSAVCVIFSHSHDVFAAGRAAGDASLKRKAPEPALAPAGAAVADDRNTRSRTDDPDAPPIPATMPDAPVDDDKKEAPTAPVAAASFYNRDSKRGAPIVTDRPSTVSQRIRDDAEEIAAYLAFQARSAAASTSSGGAAAAAAAAASSSFSSSSSSSAVAQQAMADRSGVPTILTSLPAHAARRPFGAAAAPAPKECVEEGIGSLDDDDNIDTLIEITALDAKVIGSKKETVLFSSKLLERNSNTVKAMITGDKEWSRDAQKALSDALAFEKFEHLIAFHALLQHVDKNPETDPRQFLRDSLAFLNATCTGTDEQGASKPNLEEIIGIIMQKAHKLDIKPIITMCAMWFGAKHIDNPVFIGLIKLYDDHAIPSGSEEKADTAEPRDRAVQAVTQIRNKLLKEGLVKEINKDYFSKNLFEDDIIRIIITDAIFSVKIAPNSTLASKHNYHFFSIYRRSITVKILHDHCFLPRICDFSGIDLSNNSLSAQEQAALLWKELNKIPTKLQILQQIPYSCLKDTLIKQVVAPTLTQGDFNFQYWYFQLSPAIKSQLKGYDRTGEKRGSRYLGPDRWYMIERIEDEARTFVREGHPEKDFEKRADRAQIQAAVKMAVAKIPEGIRKMVLRKQFYRIYHTNIDQLDITRIGLNDGVFLSNLGLTTLLGISEYLLLLDDQISITRLDLQDNKLVTLVIPPLPDLRELFLHNNKLINVTIPPLQNLTTLYLGTNKLVNVTIPSLPDLRELYLHSNKLINVTIPPLPNLTTLYLGTNELTNITIPSFPNLTILNLHDNKLVSVTIPSLPNLTTVYLSKNKLTNLKLPHLPKLTRLDLDNNEFSPEVIAALKTQYPFAFF
jgi:hypothetical protein